MDILCTKRCRNVYNGFNQHYQSGKIYKYYNNRYLDVIYKLNGNKIYHIYDSKDVHYGCSNIDFIKENFQMIKSGVDIICKKKCLDSFDKQYNIGGKYRYYEGNYAFNNHGEKIYDIYLNDKGVDSFVGYATMNFIDLNFEDYDSVFRKIVCISSCSNIHNQKYEIGKVYKYSDEDYLDGLDIKYYSIYDERDNVFAYAHMNFIQDNFVDYMDYEREMDLVDKMFDDCLKS